MNAMQVQDTETAILIHTEDIEVGIGIEEDVLHLVPAEAEADIVEDIKEVGIGMINIDIEEEEKDLPRIPDRDLNSHFLSMLSDASRRSRGRRE